LLEEIFSGDRKPPLVKIPPLARHGFKAIRGETVYAIKIPTELYN